MAHTWEWLDFQSEESSQSIVSKIDHRDVTTFVNSRLQFSDCQTLSVSCDAVFLIFSWQR